MPSWAWIVIVVAAIVVIAAVARAATKSRRSRALQERFGPEYERTLRTTDDKREAEAELAARAERRDSLDIRPLTSVARERYLNEWQGVQARFVDDPEGAVRDADALIQSALRERGYPVDDFEQRSADISVDHPHVVENYRQGHRLAGGSTEELRQAMQHYRLLFEELVDTADDAPLARDRADAGAARR
jgi:hypothetical protein